MNGCVCLASDGGNSCGSVPLNSRWLGAHCMNAVWMKCDLASVLSGLFWHHISSIHDIRASHEWTILIYYHSIDWLFTDWLFHLLIIYRLKRLRVSRKRALDRAVRTIDDKYIYLTSVNRLRTGYLCLIYLWQDAKIFPLETQKVAFGCVRRASIAKIIITSEYICVTTHLLNKGRSRISQSKKIMLQKVMLFTNCGLIDVCVCCWLSWMLIQWATSHCVRCRSSLSWGVELRFAMRNHVLHDIFLFFSVRVSITWCSKVEHHCHMLVDWMMIKPLGDEWNFSRGEKFTPGKGAVLESSYPDIIITLL